MIPVLEPVTPRLNPWPWRSVWLAGAVLVAALVAGVPPFLRMPPWVDLTLYDVAARNLFEGGVHYRDVFDTNLPGFVWALALVRATLGWSVEALRAVDLLVVGGAVLLLDRLAARGGAPRAARLWAGAAVAAFYPFTPDSVHAQRDLWMTLPALAAVVLRVRRLATPREAGAFRSALLEGALWALAVWVKPHVVVPAAAVWLATAGRCFANGGRADVLADFCGNVIGGLLIGGGGVAYLVASGTWPSFVEAFTFWNAGYARTMWAELPGRVEMQLHYFPPWSYLQVAAVPVAVLMLLDARGFVSRLLPVWLWSPATSDAARLARVAVAAVYLGWTAQALVIQRQFLYVHVPEVLMLLAVLAAQRWAAGCLVVAWVAATTVAVALGASPPQAEVPEFREPERWWAVRHVAADPVRARQWAGCLSTDLTPEGYRRRMTDLGRMQGFHAANDWVELGEVGDWLRAHGATAHDVIAWHDAPHAVYLTLDGRPAFRFQHVSQMMGIGAEQEYRLRRELYETVPRVRFVVSDLLREGSDDPNRLPDWTGVGADHLPPSMRLDVRAGFPFTVPVVFRSGDGRGRYLIHDLRARE
jgi:hypothetical protein